MNAKHAAPVSEPAPASVTSAAPAPSTGATPATESTPIAGFRPIWAMAMKTSARSTAIFSVALVIVMSIYLSVYESMGNSDAMNTLLAQFPDSFTSAFGMQDLGSGAGWAQTTFFGLLGLFLIIAAAVAAGARAIAGDEESGMLELTMSRAVSRTGLYLGRLASMITMILVLTVVSGISLVVWNNLVSLSIEGANMLPQLTAFFGIALLCGSLALAAGAATGSRSTAVGSGTAMAVAAFLLNAVGNVKASWGWMHTVSPISWAYQNRPLANGWDLGGIALLYGASVVLLILGWFVFVRRDITG